MLKDKIPIKYSCDLIIFGAKGDLARKKLIPALYQLEKKHQIHKESRIIGVGRANWNKLEYINIVYDSLNFFLKEKIDEQVWNKLYKRLDFCFIDVNKIEHFYNLNKLIIKKNNIVISYFAMPSNTFYSICKGLKSIKLNKIPHRIIMEKPVGHSLKTAQEINHQVSRFFQENQIFRIDHYLGKETIINLLTLRFANSFFLTNWNNKNIDHIQITVAENVGIEGRWNYFNQNGQMRDMIQNHLLQILTIITMTPPNSLSSDNIRNEKVKILKSLRKIDKNNIKQNTVRGQYLEGIINNYKVPGYLEESGSTKISNTETFVAIQANIDNWQWLGVPFYLRTGKRLPLKCTEIIIVFKTPIFNLFKSFCPKLPSNKLIIRLQPNEGISIEILNRAPGAHHLEKLKKIKLNLNYSEIFDKKESLDAYERLILESIKGKQSLFVRKDEVEESWKWIDSIIKTWNKENIPLKKYYAGTWGPNDANILINKNGHYWYNR